jgi:hypothetical protein
MAEPVLMDNVVVWVLFTNAMTTLPLLAGLQSSSSANAPIRVSKSSPSQKS